MATIPTTERTMKAGDVLEAKYKGKTYECRVEPKGGVGPEVVYVTTNDAGETKSFNSPSSSGSFIRDGKATNGWAFWHVKGSATEADPAGDQPEGEPAEPPSNPEVPGDPEEGDEPAQEPASEPERELATTTATRRRGGRRAPPATATAAGAYECGECGFRAATPEEVAAHFETEHAVAA